MTDVQDNNDLNVLRVARALDFAAGAALAEIEQVDLVTGVSTVELIRATAQGNAAVRVPLNGLLDDVTRQVVALMGAQGAVLLPNGAGLVTLSAGLAIDVQAINAARIDHFVMLACDGTRIAVLDNTEAGPILHVSVAGQLQTVDAAVFAQGPGRCVTAMAFVADRLHVAMADSLAGFDIFVLDIAQKAPDFALVVSRGADRFALNAAITTMHVGPEGLLMGTAALASGTDQIGNWGTELLLMLPDGGWDLVIGQPRFSQDGLKLPAGQEMPGLGDVANSAIKAIVRSAQRTVIAVQDYAGAPQDDRRQLRPDFADYHGRLRLFQSADLVSWAPLPHSLPDEIGAVSSLCLMPEGLLVGHEQFRADDMPLRLVPLD
jgi:hypothetical protein